MTNTGGIPGSLATEVTNLVSIIARELKPRLNDNQWQTTRVLLQSILNQSHSSMYQYYEAQQGSKEIEVLLTEIQKELDLLEDYLTTCLMQKA